MQRLQCLVRGSRRNLCAKVGSSRLLEVAREDGLEEGAEDELGTTASALVTIRALRTGKRAYPVWGSASQRVKMSLNV
jgi:hypothetical protein